MTDNDVLTMLKIDLQVSTSATSYDTYLTNFITLARAAIEKEGIKLADNVEDGMLVEMYAAYLYRKRRENVAMPRSLRYALNNRLFSQKGSAT